jgi:hypothetical protein
MGGKWEKVKKCFSSTFYWPPSLEHSIGHQTLEHSIGHQTLDFFSPPFFFSSEDKLGSLRVLSFLGHNFKLKS